MKHLYLDMDGVQCDFFGEWARAHNVAHYKEIIDPEAAILELGSRGPDAVYTFFRNLKPLNGGFRVVQLLKEHNIPYTVLSAPLRVHGDISIQAKRDWLDEHNPGTSSSAIFTSKKHHYAKDCVLVDDFGRYCDLWNKAGGIAIKHSDETTDDTISKLINIYQL